MKIYYALKSEFDCVYMINGTFYEKADVINYPAMSPLYVTVFPLNAVLLPYTVKLLGGRAVCNEQLAQCNEVAPEHFIVRLKERHNYVYSPAHTQAVSPERGLAPEFYRAIKSGDFAKARNLMTKELSESVDDDTLAEFFAPYCDIVENRFADLSGGFFLINKNTLKGEPFSIDVIGERISDIKEG